MYNQGMNGCNILYMGMSKNVVIFLDCHPMIFGKFCNALYNQYGYDAAKEFTLN